MAGRPPDGRQGHSGSSGGLLLDIEDSNPLYNDGQRAPVNDDQLQHHYDAADSEALHNRPSTSYDEFLNTPNSRSAMPRGPGASPAGNTQRPFLSKAFGPVLGNRAVPSVSIATDNADLVFAESTLPQFIDSPLCVLTIFENSNNRRSISLTHEFLPV